MGKYKKIFSNIRSIISKNYMLLILVMSFLGILPSYNKFWHPYDEWVLLEAGDMINKGMVPYRDFFILLYPPAQMYVIAGILKISGMGIMAVRLYTILVQSVICALVFYIIKKISSFWYASIGFIVCLSIIPSYGRPIAIPTWPAIALSLLSTLFLLTFLQNNKISYLTTAGFILGMTVVFRHDIAFYTFFSGALGLFLFSVYKMQNKINSTADATKDLLKSGTMYVIFPILFIVGAIAFLHKIGALSDAFRSIFIFPAEYVKRASLPFPPFCFDFSMIFHKGCLFIEQNQFYIPIIACISSALLIAMELISKKKIDLRIISITIILLLAIFYLPQVAIRTDIPHLATAFPPSTILFGLIYTFRIKYKNTFLKVVHVFVVSFMTLLGVLLIYKDTESYFKDTFGKAFIRKSIIPVAFRQGTLYVPVDGRDTLLALMEYVEKNTKPDEKIYVGPLNHSIDQFNPYQVLYFVTGRLPAVKYYEISPGLHNREYIQEEMVGSLKQNKARVLILRDYKTGEAGLGPLDRYIRKKYTLDKIIDTYHIYVKK